MELGAFRLPPLASRIVNIWHREWVLVLGLHLLLRLLCCSPLSWGLQFDLQSLLTSILEQACLLWQPVLHASWTSAGAGTCVWTAYVFFCMTGDVALLLQK